ncbi:MAG: pilus assembly protein PilP [Marinobacter sp.]|nr:pilus assembly protein PilP [Marinobacter sp.]
MADKHAKSAWFSLCAASMLAACSPGSDFRDLDVFMAETRARPIGSVEPLPEFQTYEAFAYGAADRRAPFEPPIEVQLTMVDQAPTSDIEPDLDRPREVLEGFPIADLRMVGTLQRVGESGLFALVADRSGGIHRVSVGNHLGQNHGRIVGVVETRIEVVEIIPDGRGGWVERPRTLSLDEG